MKSQYTTNELICMKFINCGHSPHENSTKDFVHTTSLNFELNLEKMAIEREKGVWKLESDFIGLISFSFHT